MRLISAVRWGTVWMITVKHLNIEADFMSLPGADYSYSVKQGEQLVRYGTYIPSVYIGGAWWRPKRRIGNAV